MILISFVLIKIIRKNGIHDMFFNEKRVRYSMRYNNNKQIEEKKDA